MRYCCASVLVLSVTSAALASSTFGRYEVIALGPASGYVNGSPGINDLGQVCFGSGNVGDPAMVWRDGVSTPLAKSAGVIPTRINNQGDVIAPAAIVPPAGTVDVWLDGVGSQLRTLSGVQFASPRDINDQRVIALTSGNEVGYTYNVATKALNTLGSLTSDVKRQFVNAMNNAGQVVGSTDNAQGYGRAFVSLNGVMTDLSANEPLTLQTGANDINNRGVAVGYFGSTFDLRACVFRDGLAVQLASLGSNNIVSALAINDDGLIVGHRLQKSGGFRAIVWDDAGAHGLDELAINGAGWTFSAATGINSNGWITGFGTFNGQDRNFVMRPVPTPSALMIGAVWCFTRPDRRRCGPHA